MPDEAELSPRWRSLAAVPSRTHADTIRLLRRTGGYTDQLHHALRDGWDIEPEAISADYATMLADRAALDRSNQRITTRADLAQAPAAVRLARAKAQAKATRVDAHRELRLIRLAITNGRSVEHVSKRLAVLERKLWPDLPA